MVAVQKKTERSYLDVQHTGDPYEATSLKVLHLAGDLHHQQDDGSLPDCAQDGTVHFIDAFIGAQRKLKLHPAIHRQQTTSEERMGEFPYVLITVLQARWILPFIEPGNYGYVHFGAYQLRIFI
jgi:hypothetical protein